MDRDLTQGNELRSIIFFSIPMIIGNLLQQLYNVVDTLIVGRVLGGTALAAVGSSFALMTFLTSITLGLCMGSGVVFAQFYGAKKTEDLKSGVFNAFCLIGIITLIINITVYLFLDKILLILNIPAESYSETKIYLIIIFSGIMFTFIYNFFAAILRSVGNSLSPLIFLAVSAVINIILDIIFVIPLKWGVAGAAFATVIAQFVSALCCVIYYFKKMSNLKLEKRHFKFNKIILKLIAKNSILTSVQQSVMNFGILMIQGLVNSFGVTVTAAFAAAVKIDSFAYMPLQDFGNSFSTYIAQNYGAGKTSRIKKGIKSSIILVIIFSIIISIIVVCTAPLLMKIFVKSEEIEIISIGARYLKIEGTFYLLIGILFLLYGLYRGIGRAGMSVVLTIISLGTRVGLSYLLSPNPKIGLIGIWISIPIGWFLADAVGILYYVRYRKILLREI